MAHLPFLPLFARRCAGQGGDMRKEVSLNLIDAVRRALQVADGLGLSETSLHLNAALVTLDGRGLPPPRIRSGSVH